MTTELLQKNYRRKVAIKEKELELKKMKLKFQQGKWLLEEEEQKKSMKLDNKKMRLEAEECRALIELLKEHAKYTDYTQLTSIIHV